MTGPDPSLGQLLRRYRLLAGLTQEELAERSAYSTDYISKLERDQRQPPLVTIDRLAAVLGLGQPEHQTLRAARERHERAAPASRAPRWAPLPAAPTPLVGRVAEQAAVWSALDTSRLVTLTGAGGTGKTRLALEVARRAAEGRAFADGVAFVDCGPLTSHGLLGPTIARALGLVEQPDLPSELRLLEALRSRHLLLVIDTLEHLLAETPLLSRLLAAAPQLHILATSRAPLHLYGEYEVHVPPLSLPSAGGEPSDQGADASEAVQLFVARARAVAPGFDAGGSARATLGALCRALDGLPLAIELAAARVTLFPPEALLDRLGECLAVLADGPRDLPHRQQTLRATLDWSFRLLAPPEQALFTHLGVFAGSFDARAAAAICTPDTASGPEPEL
ncbi:MAG TPA: helix-turn-helix domain-containing protein, partial [Nitrolancea sp.]|nr:helix-turn-helix domain-containing protein [Nitrolancea sp.]